MGGWVVEKVGGWVGWEEDRGWVDEKVGGWVGGKTYLLVLLLLLEWVGGWMGGWVGGWAFTFSVGWVDGAKEGVCLKYDEEEGGGEDGVVEGCLGGWVGGMRFGGWVGRARWVFVGWVGGWVGGSTDLHWGLLRSRWIGLGGQALFLRRGGGWVGGWVDE